MVLCNVECLKMISNYLEVCPGKLETCNNNTVVATNPTTNRRLEGFATIIQSLINNSKSCNEMFNDKLVLARTRQWLEYAVICLNYADNPLVRKKILKHFNWALKDTTYLSGTIMTIADVTAYYVLHSVMRDMPLQEKAEYVHVSRWFDNIQQEEKVRQRLNLISFDLIYLYL